jgi:hypothetical protein
MFKVTNISLCGATFWNINHQMKSNGSLFAVCKCERPQANLSSLMKLQGRKCKIKAASEERQHHHHVYYNWPERNSQKLSALECGQNGYRAASARVLIKSKHASESVSRDRAHWNLNKLPVSPGKRDAYILQKRHSCITCSMHALKYMQHTAAP